MVLGLAYLLLLIIAAVISMAIVVAASSIEQALGRLYNIVGNSIPK